MAMQTGSTYNSEKYDSYHQNSNGKPKVFDHRELEDSVPGRL